MREPTIQGTPEFFSLHVFMRLAHLGKESIHLITLQVEFSLLKAVLCQVPEQSNIRFNGPSY